MSNSSLENIIKTNAKAYYTTGEQKISDEVFDAIVDKVKEDNPDSEVLTTGWSYKPESDNKIKHKYCHIGSLEKITEVNKIIEKLGRSEQLYTISAKLDGLSCVLYYEKGKLVKALTRGDGEYGVDITEKIQYINGVPQQIADFDFTGAVRGELLISKDIFTHYLKEHPEAKNPRNTAAGLINGNLETVKDDLCYITLYVYTVIANENNATSNYSFVRMYNNWLLDNFNYVVPYTYLFDSDIDNTVLLNLREKYSEDLPIDGLVITKDIVEIDNRGVNKYKQIAFKFQDEIKIAIVKHIEWTMSKHNAYIPVVVFEEPIELEGTQVKKATGYNAKWILDMNIHKGSVVVVRKAHQIIPQIVEVINEV